MEFEPLQNAMGLGRWVERLSADVDSVRIGITRIDEIAHAMSKTLRGSVIRDLHVAPRFMRVDEHEPIGRAPLRRFAIVALQPARRDRDRLPDLPISCVGLSPKQTTGRFGSASSAKRSSTSSMRATIGAVHLRDAPHVLAPGFQVVLGQAPAQGDRMPVRSQTYQRRGIGRGKAKHLRKRRSWPLNREASECIAFSRARETLARRRFVCGFSSTPNG
jgi:hypothetical protein